MKDKTSWNMGDPHGYTKGFSLLRSFLLLLVLTASPFLYAWQGYSLESQIYLSLNNVSLREVLGEIEKSTEFSFIYRSNEIDLNRRVSVTARGESVESVLKQVLKSQNLAFEVDGRHIIIYKSTASAVLQPNQTIRGIITDAQGEPIIGASVLIKGTSTGTVSDLNGRFELQVEGAVTLLISFLGMRTIEMPAQPGQELKVVMQEVVTLMDEVVVTGYGNFKRSSYTGAASIVTMEKLQDIPTVTAAQMLEAQIPGVSISGLSGQPGAFQQIRIRGTGSFNASNEPLFVLDGIPVMSGNLTNDENNPGGLDFFSTLNPADIESITVLKDATSTALYGARGANGVILITTKKGKEGKTTYALKASWGFTDLAMQYRPIMGGQERRELIHEGYVNEWLNYGYTQAEAVEYADSKIDNFAAIPEGGYSDWIGALFKKGHMQTYEFTANGGQEHSNFSMSLGYTKSSGISLSTDFERYSGRLNYTNRFKRLTLGMSAFFTLTENNMTPEQYYYASAIYSSRYELTPSVPIYKSDGTYNTGFYTNNGGYNPLFENENTESFTRIGRLLGSVNAEYRILDPLKLATTFNVDYGNTKEFRYWGPESFDGRSTQGAGQMWRPEYLRYNSNTSLNYMQTFGGKHNFDATVAFEVMSLNYEMLYGRAQVFGQKANHKLSNATTPVELSNYEDNDRLISYVGRLNYDYASKYYLSASYRYDGSSRLSPDERWAGFWSLSGSWRISAEPFMKATENWLTDLKLKGSYGVNGTLPSQYYGYMGTYTSASQYGAKSAIYEYRRSNAKLTWEKGYMANIGIEAILFGRLSLTADFYQRDTKDLLMDKPLYAASGFLSMVDNIGHIRNRGLELEIASENIRTKDFRWSTTLNLSSNQSKIIKTTEDASEIIDGRLIQRQGEAMNTIYVLESAGVNPDNGLAQYYINEPQADGTLSRDITTNPNQAFRICAADPAPDLQGALGNTFSYKFVDLNFSLSFSLGGRSIDNGLYALQDDGRWDRYNKSTELRRRWKQPGDITDVPRYVNGYMNGGWYTSTRALHSTDHLRVKTLSIGLTAPRKWTNAIGATKARLYFAANNLFTWAAYDQYDPELGPQVNFNVPPTKTLSFGVELTF